MNKKSDKRLKRILIAAPKSGSGKTMVTCGLLNLFKEKGIDVTSFKCGPDYIDPMFHKKVLGIYGGNLDTFFTLPSKVKEILLGCGHDMAVIEGVMGIYDGLGGLALEGSCYDIAKATDTPIILIADGKGAGRSLISGIKGILSDDTEHLIKGIILNRVSEGFYPRLRDTMEKELKESYFDVKLLGAIPEIKNLAIDSRHLGLLRPDEISDLKDKISMVSKALDQHIDIKTLLSIMEEGSRDEGSRDEGSRTEEFSNDENSDAVTCVNGNTSVLKERSDNDSLPSVTLAVAMDDAFCFYYRENLELFKKLGVTLKFFSPIRDKALPDDIQGIYIGGGYPELHLKELSDNASMRVSILEAINSGIPSFAECGGFMYLHESIYDEEGKPYEMVGAISASCQKKERLVRFGYVELSSDEEVKDKSSFANVLGGIRGHEFHYYDSTDNGEDMLVKKAGDDKCWRALHVDEKKVWGFPHLYLESNPSFASCFVEAMRNVR